MVFVFDENYSHRLATGLNYLEEGNKNRKNVEAEVWHIKELATHLKIQPLDGNSYMDGEVIEIVGKKNGILITQDNDFKRIKHLKGLLKENNVGVIIFKTFIDTSGYWNMVSSIVTRWHEIKAVVEHRTPPFCLMVDKKGIHEYKF